MAKRPKILASVGNRKVGKDTLIMNITSAHDCASRKRGLCQVPSGACYAWRDENLYKAVLPYRRRQTRIWDALTAEEIADQVRVLVNRQRKIPIRYLRMQEAGDFRNKADIDKMSKIADLLKGVVTVYTYTARRDLFPHPHSANLVINGSGFMVDNNFKVINEDQLEPGPKCRGIKGGGCYGCYLCKTKGHKTIQEVLRGSKKPVPNRSDIPRGYLEPTETVSGVQSGVGSKTSRKVPKNGRRRRGIDTLLRGLR